MKQDNCGNCAYFRQHYTFDTQKIFRVYCGHCTYPKPRTRKPDANICENYRRGLPPEENFVSKEFLSKTMLEYLMKLELLPLIEESQE